MGIFDSVEKVINEHGSATILKERIEWVKEQYADLERKLLKLQEENGALRRENEELRKAQPKAEHSTGRLEEIKEKLLLLLAQQPNIPEPRVVSTLGLNPQVAKFHLHELQEA